MRLVKSKKTIIRHILSKVIQRLFLTTQQNKKIKTNS